MQNSLELIIYISIWSVIGVFLVFYILFPLKTIKNIEKTVSLYSILSKDELTKRLKHIIKVESELPPVLYSYSAGWRKESPLIYHLQELDNQFFSFNKKMSRSYHLKGTMKIIEENQSNKLLFIFDHSLDYKVFVVYLFGIFFLFSFIFPLIYNLWMTYLYLVLSPFIFILGAPLTLKSVQNLVERYRVKFIEKLKEKILS